MSETELKKLVIDEPQMIKVERVGQSKAVALIRLNRPNALNALCSQLMDELGVVLVKLDMDKTVKAIILTGSDKAFAAGADVKEMASLDFPAVFGGSYLSNWGAISGVRKPVIAAVNGFALGGGTELALMCDIVYAGDKAQFGQPEVRIGTIPGAGGTQRWPRYTSKSFAMEACLTGNTITAQEAKEAGLVSKVFPADQLLDETIKLAEKIATHSPIIVQTIKESINTAYETTLDQGLHMERRLFHATFAIDDRKEGMAAFTEKRKPDWASL